MNDIRPPKKPPVSPPSPTPVTPVPAQPQRPQSLEVETPLPEQPQKSTVKKRILWVFAAILTLVIAVILGALVWYKLSLMPVSAQDESRIRVHITSGSSPSQIASLLQEKKLIRSALAFDIYTRLSRTQSQLQAGTYNLSPSESTEEIVGHIASGKTDEFAITFLPGATLAENRAVLLKAGFSETEVDSALGKTYNHPLFTDKPAGTDLEGYIYGETYSFDSSATVEQVLAKTFDEYYQAIKDNNLIDGFKAQGLNLYQGITLASIIQREVPHETDQKQVAQVFFTRLSEGIPLGSDVTYQYAAKKLGVTPSPDLDSPYNTRKYAGLPPGPIASPGLTALEAVANPASGDYLFFLSGDDDVTYYAHTDAEHVQNIRDHCKIKCALP